MSDVRLIGANGMERWLKTNMANANPLHYDIKDTYSECITMVHCMETIDAVPVVRCRECKNGAPLPEEARAEFSPGVMRCLAGRGDCDKYCTTWEDGFCDEGAKMDGGAEG